MTVGLKENYSDGPTGYGKSFMICAILAWLIIIIIIMLKTYQVKAHCKGDSHSSKTANTILPGFMTKQR